MPAEERETVFVAGDDTESKALVSGLMEEIGFAPEDVGTLAEIQKQEPGSPAYNVPVTPREALAGMR